MTGRSEQRVVVVSGSAGGIGSALRAQLQADGTRVIGIDRHDADVVADLATAEGRTAALQAVHRLAGPRLDGLVCAAGLGGTARPLAQVVAVNCFGALALLEGLQPLLQASASGSAVVVSSVAAWTAAWDRHPLTRACLDGDEAAVLALCEALDPPYQAYACSKRALMDWVQVHAVDWGRAGVRLNAVAPGPVDTPLHRAALDDPALGAATRAFVPALGRIAQPREIACVLAFLLSDAASFVHGAVWSVDGGSPVQRPGPKRGA